MWVGGLLFAVVMSVAPSDGGLPPPTAEPPQSGQASLRDGGSSGVAPATERRFHGSTFAPTPPELVDPVERATRLGREIYAQDQVSARATDLLLARIPDSRKKPGVGWVTVPGPWWKVLFLTGEGEALRVMYEANFPRDEPPASSQPTLQAPEPPRPLEPDEAIRWKALQTVLRSRPGTCKGPLNPVILPASAIGREGWLVYLLAATTDPNVQILGGHQRYLVSPDGAQIVERVDLSQCITGQTLPPKAKAAVQVLTTPFFEVPHEGHVFVALSTHFDLLLGTFKKAPVLWGISADGSVGYLGLVQRPDGGR
jgi:hypothetical protein